jgi:hypothetical protein
VGAARGSPHRRGAFVSDASFSNDSRRHTLARMSVRHSTTAP